MLHKKRNAVVTLFHTFVLTVFLVACGGEQGPVGPQGPQGVKGDAGPQGPKGDVGTPGSGLASSVACSETIYIGSLSLLAQHYIYTFSDGSVLTECSINDGSASYSRMFMYPKTSVGASDGACLLMYDLDTTSSGGMFSFSLASTRAQSSVRYSDATGNPSSVQRIVSCRSF